MYTVETSRHFVKRRDVQSGAIYYVLATHVAPQQQAFYFVNPSMSSDCRYLWFWCTFPPASYYTLAVIDFLTDEIYHFPETEFADATPLVDEQTGEAYYATLDAVYRRQPDPQVPLEHVCDLPAVLFENHAKLLCPATHLTFSPDRQKLLLDAQTTKGWIVGALNLATGDFKVYSRPALCRNHGQFNPVYPDLALTAEEFWSDENGRRVTIRTDENGVFMRLWTVTGDGEEKVWPPLELQKATHEWWSADGQKIYYCRYNDTQGNNGICAINIFTGEHRLVAPVKAWHGFSSKEDDLFVFDENKQFYRGTASKVGLYNAKTGKKVYIVSENPAVATPEKPAKYHLDPHPRFNGGQQYITFSTSVFGRIDLAVAKTDDILPLTRSCPGASLL